MNFKLNFLSRPVSEGIAALAVLSAVPFVAPAMPKDAYLDFSDNYIEVADSNAIDLAAGAFTLAAWIKPTGWGENMQGRILDHGGGSSGASGWSLHLDNSASAGSPQALRMQINNTSFNNLSDPGVVTLDTWQLVVVTHDGSNLHFYVDGVLVGSRTGAPIPLSRNTGLRIGARATDEKRFFAGAMDDVRVWDRALGYLEVVNLYQGDLTALGVGLVAHYPFIEGAGQTVAETTASGYDGQLGSQPTADFRDPLWRTSGPVANQAPAVSAGPDQLRIWSEQSVGLAGSVADDGLPAANTTVRWRVAAGSGAVKFAEPTSATTAAWFAKPGTYVLQLSANDTELEGADELTVVLDSQPKLTSLEIVPAVITVTVDTVQQFSVVGRDQGGAPFPVAPEWSTTGGSIDPQSGLYTANSSAGEFTVTVTNAGVSGHASVAVNATEALWPTAGWTLATPQEMGLDESLLEQARDYARATGGAGMITQGGRLVMSWGNVAQRYDVKSTTKSIGAAVLGLAISDGLVQLGDAAQQYLPDIGLPPGSNASTGWLDDITVQDLASHTAGFDKAGGFKSLLFQPGTQWAYTDGGANWLADMLTNLYGQDLSMLAFNRLFTPMGLTSDDLVWRDNFYRPDLLNGIKRREFGSGVIANVDALARIGYLMLRGGRWEAQALIPDGFIEQLRAPVPGVAGLPVVNDSFELFASGSSHYGLLWWNNADGAVAGVPIDAYWAWGLGDSLIVVIPSLDMAISRAGGEWPGNHQPSFYQVLGPFLSPISQAALADGSIRAPVLALTSPVAGAVSGLVELAATASDDTGVTAVEFRLGNAVIGVDTAAPYAITWDSRTVRNGAYTLSASATDSAGNTSVQSITVSLINDAVVH